MQLKALITTLILGSSSVALADTQIRDHRTPTHTIATTTVVAPAPVVTKPTLVVTNRLDGRVDGRWNIVRRRQPLTYVSLANNLALDGRANIALKPTKRQFSKLELRAEGNGRTRVKVIVFFGNGRTQTIDLDAKLHSKKQRAISIDLKGDTRNIERVILVGKSNGRNASVDVLAI